MDALQRDLQAALRAAEQLSLLVIKLKQERDSLQEQVAKLEARLLRGAQAYEELSARLEAARMAKAVSDPDLAAALHTQIDTYIAEIDHCLTLLGNRA